MKTLAAVGKVGPWKPSPRQQAARDSFARSVAFAHVVKMLDRMLATTGNPLEATLDASLRTARDSLLSETPDWALRQVKP